MPIDNCKHSFEELASKVLPDYLDKFSNAIEKEAVPAKAFSSFKSVSKAFLDEIGKTHDFPGCYVFIEKKKVIYVGISRGVLRRVKQHLSANTHNSASLTYRMATRELSHKMRRDEAMLDNEFLNQFKLTQTKLGKMDVAYIEIHNDLELYLFEVFAAMHFDTTKWNTFRTH
jgi:predicted GIY-YIG superfamily endonuclease